MSKNIIIYLIITSLSRLIRGWHWINLNRFVQLKEIEVAFRSSNIMYITSIMTSDIIQLADETRRL